jgi:hypothetical protein
MKTKIWNKSLGDPAFWTAQGLSCGMVIMFGLLIWELKK